jgi:SAM-dependent methyltransferase
LGLLRVRAMDARTPVSKFNDLSIQQFLANEFSRIPAEHRMSLLDLGCGSRPYCPLYEHRFRFHIAADYNVRGPIQIRVNANRLPFRDGCFDVVLLSEVIEHVPDAQTVLAEIDRVLKPGGYLLITWPFNYMMHEVPQDYVRFTEFGMDQLLADTTMRIEHIVRRGNAFAVLAALAEFLLLGFLHIATHIPVVGPLFVLLRRFISRVVFDWGYRLCLALNEPDPRLRASVGDSLKGPVGHLAHWTLGFCATVRKTAHSQEQVGKAV